MTYTHVRKIFDLSTAHVTKETRDWLNEEGFKAATYERPPDAFPALHVARHVYGWFFYCDEEPDTDDFPADIVAIMAEARRRGCEYAMLDADAPDIDTLPKYEW